MVIYRYSLQTAWDFIRKCLESRLKRIIEVVPLSADRAVMWCVNNDEMKSLLQEKFVFSGRRNMAKMEKLSSDAHWDYVQIEVQNSWIGVEGLPLDLWNHETFKTVGETCRGLIEVAEETSNQSFLMHAKLKVKGQRSSFLYSVMELPYKGMKLHLGLFNLENHHWRGWKNGITYGLVTRSICSLPGQDDDVVNRIADGKLRMEQHVNSEASM